MTTTVAKPFNSTTRHFIEGQPVSILDDLSPHTFEDLRARHFIVTKRDPVPVADAIEIETPTRRAK